MAYDQHAEYQPPTRRYNEQNHNFSQRPPSNQRNNGHSGQVQPQGNGGYGYDDYGYAQDHRHGQEQYSDGPKHGSRGPRPPRQHQQQPHDDFGYNELIGGYEEERPPPPQQDRRHVGQGPPPRGSSRGGPAPPQPHGRGGQQYGYDEPMGQNGNRRPPPGPRQHSAGRGPPMPRPPNGYPPQQQGGRGRPPPRSDSRAMSGGAPPNRPPQNFDGRPGSGQPRNRPPSSRERMPKPHSPMAPTQDNAFPSFPTKKSEASPKRSPKPSPDVAELEDPLSRMNMNGHGRIDDRARPLTSSSHRSKISHGSSHPQKPTGFHDSGYQESFEPPFANQRPGYMSKDSFNSRPSLESPKTTRSSQQPHRKSPPSLPPLQLGSSNFDRTSGEPGAPVPSSSLRAFGPPQRAVTMPDQRPPEDTRLSAEPSQQWARPAPAYESYHSQPTSPGYAPPRPYTSSGSGNNWNQSASQDTPKYKAFTSPQYEVQDPIDSGHKRDESLSDLYDDYYDDADDSKSSREAAIEEDMPNFDAIPVAQSPRFTLHFNSPPLHVNKSPDFPQQFERPAGASSGLYQQAKYSRSQPDLRAQAREDASYTMDANAPPMPRMTPGPGPRGRGMPPTDMMGGYGQRPPQSQQGFDFGPHGRPSVDDQRPSLQLDQARHSNPDALPQHPVPVRPGLMEKGGSPLNGQQVLNRPPPVRQYNNSLPSGPVSSERPRDSVDRRSSVPVTHAELNKLRSTLSSSPHDRKVQLLLAKKLVEAARVLADENGTADIKTRNKNREKFIAEAHKNLKKLVSMGYPEGLFYMADCYGSGTLGIEDPKEAFNLYQQAAKMNHPQSAYRTAVCCEIGAEDGGGTRKDPVKAVQWYKHAAALGDPAAMYKAGMIALKGLLGQPKNLGEAVNWLKRAASHADEDNPHALHELGLLYDNAAANINGALPRDENQAFQLFKQAADLGYKFSQFRLGQAFEYGQLNLPIDARNSIAWYSRAAAQGEHQSELALSGWYLTGSPGILEQSDTEAYLWARKASTADPPLPKAMFAMGYFTEVGIGCPRSLEEAKKWYGRAAAYKFPKAQERLEELKKGGMKAQKNRERLSRGNQKQQDENCTVM